MSRSDGSEEIDRQRDLDSRASPAQLTFQPETPEQIDSRASPAQLTFQPETLEYVQGFENDFDMPDYKNLPRNEVMSVQK